MDQNWAIKVTDFGLSRVVDTQNTMTHCGMVDFCAPEVLRRNRYTTKADVYSFGTLAGLRCDVGNVDTDFFYSKQ